MDAMQILVIILSVFLVLFLVLAIVLIVMLITITKRIRTVADTTVRTMAKFEGLAGNVAAASNAQSIFRVGQAFVKGFTGRRKK